MILRLGLVALLMFLSACGLGQTLVSTTDIAVVREQLILNGIIAHKTPQQLRQILQENPQVTTLVLGRVDGVADDTALTQLAYHIRERGLDTHLQSDSSVYSGGLELFMAGVNRTAVQGAEVGVHSWADGDTDGATLPRNAPAHAPHVTFTRDMLGSDDFYWFTLQAAASDEIYILNAQDLARYGLLTAPLIKL